MSGSKLRRILLIARIVLAALLDQTPVFGQTPLTWKEVDYSGNLYLQAKEFIDDIKEVGAHSRQPVTFECTLCSCDEFQIGAIKVAASHPMPYMFIKNGNRLTFLQNHDLASVVGTMNALRPVCMTQAKYYDCAMQLILFLKERLNYEAMR